MPNIIVQYDLKYGVQTMVSRLISISSISITPLLLWISFLMAKALIFEMLQCINWTPKYKINVAFSQK